MLVHEVFAMIFEGEVKQVMVCDNYPDANYLAQQLYGPDAFAVDCLQYPVAGGDKYHDGKFWRVNSDTGEEVEILAKPTEEQQVASNVLGIELNRKFAKEIFELLPSLVSTSSLVFAEESPVVEMYGEEYAESGYNANAIPNIGNLFSVIINVYGPPRS